MADTLIKGHLNQLLTDLSVAKARQGNFVADQIAPPLPVSEASDDFLKWGDEDFELEDAKYAGKSAIGRVTWSEGLGTYNAKEYAREAEISWLKMHNADAALRLEQRYTMGLVNKLRLRRENQVAGMFTTATFAHNAVSTVWTDLANAKPATDVNTAKEIVRETVGVEPNTILIPGKVWASARLTHDITYRLAQMVPNTPASIGSAAAVFGIDNVIIANAIMKGDGTYVDVWGEHVILAYIDPNAGDAEGTLQPVKQFPCDAVAAPFSTFTYEEFQTRSHVIQVYDCVDVQVIAPGAAYILTGALGGVGGSSMLPRRAGKAAKLEAETEAA